MKKLSLLALAAAGLLLGACSEKNEVVSETNATNPYGLVEGESSWIAVGISMPGDAITRGITRANEDLTDGIEAEYKVYSGTLYLFKGTNEDAATFFASYPINTTFNKESGDNVPPENSLGNEANGFGEITSTSQKIIQEIQNPSLGVSDKLYAYVILNDKDNATTITATVGSTTGLQFKQQQLKAIGIADESKGFGSIYTKTEGEVTTGGLVMTNVPIATAPGGDSDPTEADILTFTEINKDAIYKTRAEADANGAQMACIYVERAAVKVEVRLDANFGIQLDGDATSTAIDASNVKWALGNVNFSGTYGTGASAITGVGYYNTRQFDKTWLPYSNLEAADYLRYRMVGRTKFFTTGHKPTGVTGLYRTYFGKDPNYTGTGTIPYDANTGLLNAQLTDGQYTLSPSTDNSPVVTYTYENTFDENSQIYRNTTYVGVKVNINSGAAFYTIQGQPNMKLTDVNDIKTVVKTRLRDVINTKIASIDAAIDADLAKQKKSVDANSTRTISDDITKVTYDYDITVTLDNEGYNTTSGEHTYTVTGVITNIKTNDATPSPADKTAIEALATSYIGTIANPANSKVYEYKGGIAYYSARIQHFGNVETPWGAPAEAYNVYQHATNPCVYPASGQQTYGGATHNFGINHANAWLGRWGIVRNNWYVLTLKKIEGIGSPVPEDFTGEAGNTPDDNPELSYFISAEVHILPWVKRTQEVVF